MVRIFNVVVDIRKESPSFCQWLGELLSGDNKKQLWIPPGFPHGFSRFQKTQSYSVKSLISMPQNTNVVLLEMKLILELNGLFKENRLIRRKITVRCL